MRSNEALSCGSVCVAPNCVCEKGKVSECVMCVCNELKIYRLLGKWEYNVSSQRPRQE